MIARAWEMGWAARAGLAVLVGLQVVWSGDAPFYGSRPGLEAAMKLLRSGYEGHAHDRFAGFRADYRALGAALPADARVLLHETKPNLGIDHDVVLDTPGLQALVSYEGARGPRGLYDRYRSLGITHLVWRPGERPASTKQEDVLFCDYVHRFGRDARRFGPLELVALGDPPPPDDHPYHVLSLGLSGYADGLYPVAAMRTYETIPPAPATREVFAPPGVDLPAEPAAQLRLVEEADAVCVGDSFRADPAVQDRVAHLFEGATRYPTFTIFVRRAIENGGAPVTGGAP